MHPTHSATTDNPGIKIIMSRPQSQPILEIQALNVYFKSRKYGWLHAIRNLDLSLDKGEVMGLVGESGSGKSVTCLAAMRLLPPNAKVSGRILFQGRDILTMSPGELNQVRGGRAAMISQDPIGSLNPVHTVGWQIMEALRLHHGMSGNTARCRALELLKKVGVSAPERRLRDYPHQLSGGLCQRAMIAMALAGDPEIIIADEPTTALDVTIQAQILEVLRELKNRHGTSILLITHDLGVVAENCDRMAVLYGGRIAESGPVTELFKHPGHPYTRGLLASLPRLDGVEERLSPINGLVPALSDLPPGCAFSSRCDRALELCRRIQPDLNQVRRFNHFIACHSPV